MRPGFSRRGNTARGVQRQYSSTAGRVENCQIGVFLVYYSARGHIFLDRALYLPRSWTEQAKRCQAAAIPDTAGFATKPRLARQMLERALDAGVPARWVVADSVYGSVRQFRHFLASRRLAYVLSVTSDYTLRPYTAGTFADQLPPKPGSAAVRARAARTHAAMTGRCIGFISMSAAGVTGCWCAGKARPRTSAPTTRCLRLPIPL
jgi:SRSO17 transposase